MKRALLIAGGTLGGLGAVMAITPPQLTAASSLNIAGGPAIAAPAPAKGVTGSFVGPSVFVQYGDVQVQITVVDGRITDATALVAPSGKSDRYTHMAVPILIKQSLAAQSANIQGASGASYTSYGWHKSLQGALAKAGL